MIKAFLYHPRFKKKLNHLHPAVKEKAKERLRIFARSPFQASLKTHPLRGNLKGYWSFSVDRKYRVLFEFINRETVGLIDVDTHRIYK